MIWVAVVIVVAVIGVIWTLFYRWSSRVDGELRAEGMKSTPIFNLQRRSVERRTSSMSGSGSVPVVPETQSWTLKLPE